MASTDKRVVDEIGRDFEIEGCGEKNLQGQARHHDSRGARSLDEESGKAASRCQIIVFHFMLLMGNCK